jgi:signal transduction histidine kinase
MNLQIWLVACACVVSAACAGGLVFRAPERAEARLAGFLLAGAAYWAVCEIAWNLSTDAAAALAWMRASAPGWIFIGPVFLHLLARLARASGIRPFVRAAWLASALLLPLALATPWIIAAPVRTRWGWSYETGPLHPVYYGMTILCVGSALVLLRRIFGAGTFEAERRQRPALLAGIFLPLVLASLTDAFLPWFGIHVLHLGTTSFAALGLVGAVSTLRFGYSLMTSSRFSDEILASLGEGVALLYRGGLIRSVNQGLVRLSGRPREDLELLRIDELLVGGIPDPEEERLERAGELRRANGEVIPVSVTTRLVRDRQGWPLGLVVCLRDLREVESLRSRLVTSARLAALGQLAAGIAHEVNNPLAFVRANLNQLRDHWKAARGALAGVESEPGLRERVLEGEELIEESIEGVERAAEIVRSVKGFSHAGSAARESVDLNAVIDEAVAMATPQLRGRVVVERCYSELLPVHCAPQQLKQVFLNLVVNGAQAAGEGGHLRIVTRVEGDSAVVDVEDDGCGIPAEIQERIFEPFFTTKGVGEGTGLGLAIAYEIVRAHGGEIGVESQAGAGARFRVRLPARPQEGSA